MAANDSDSLLIALLLIAFYEDDDDPFVYEIVYRRLREQLRRTEEWGPELDELLMHRLRRGPRSDRRRREARDIANSVLDGYRQGIEGLVSQRLSQSQGQIDSVLEHQKEFASRLQDLHAGNRQTAHEFHSYLWLATSGADIAEARITRYVPARIYVSDPVPDRTTINGITKALQRLLELQEFEKSDELPEEGGSFWQDLWFKTKSVFTRKDVQERLKKTERAIELVYLDKPQAEANEHQANAASSLIISLHDTSTACIQVGSLLIVKATTSDGDSAIVARTLTHTELKQIEENQGMLRRPQEILEWLQGCQTRRLTNE